MLNFENIFKDSRGQQPNKPIVIGRQRMLQAVPMGGSVIGLKFEGGVIIAADDGLMYGGTSRYQDIKRVFSINELVVMGAGGDFADVQQLQRHIEGRKTEDLGYGEILSPSKLHTWMARLLYNCRTTMKPMQVNMVIGGMEKCVPYLGYIDTRGMAVEDNIVATGFASSMALPLMRREVTETPLLADKAAQLLRKCMEITAYRDCGATRKYYVAICTGNVSVVRGPFGVAENWEMASLVRGY